MDAGDRKGSSGLNRAFGPDQTLAILNEIGVDVVSDTDEVWMALCPFHGNLNTPAFAVNKTNGTFFCFNDSCGASGNMLSLVVNVTKKSIFGAERIIARGRANGIVDLNQVLKKAMEDEPMPTMPQSTIDVMKGLFWKSQQAREYMAGRGFTDETMLHYEIGYSNKQRSIAVPMHDAMGNPVGVVGRSIVNKRFHNSKKLPRKETLWNLHRAKREPRVVITEATFDAMRVWQATGIEAVACLGSSFSEYHATQLKKYFTQVIIMTDDDQKLTINANCRVCKNDGARECRGHNTGLKLGRQIAKAASGLSVSWAHLDSLKRYDGMKDAGDMTDDQIRYAIRHAISNFEMERMTGSMV